MTTEERDLLLKDLSARIFYEVKCQIKDIYDSVILRELNYANAVFSALDSSIVNVRPYLFPLSSMTKEQIREFNNINGSIIVDGLPGHCRNYCAPIICSEHEITMEDMLSSIDWLNAHHFDYRGLICRRLAIDATNLNIY